MDIEIIVNVCFYRIIVSSFNFLIGINVDGNVV